MELNAVAAGPKTNLLSCTSAGWELSDSCRGPLVLEELSEQSEPSYNPPESKTTASKRRNNNNNNNNNNKYASMLRGANVSKVFNKHDRALAYIPPSHV